MEYSDYPQPPFKRENSTPAWVPLVSCLGCVFVALALLFPIFAQNHNGAKFPSCISNIRQMGTGVLMYSQDYDEALPLRARWMDDLNPYLKNQDIYRCPDISKKGRRLFGYAFQMQLSGKKLKNILNPATTVILFDSSNTEWNASDALTSLPDPPRHSDGNHAGYLDGHAKRIQFPLNSSSN